MSDDETPDSVLMTAPVSREVADQFRDIAKGNNIPIRVLGGMLYERFVADHSAGKVSVAPVQLVTASATQTTEAAR
jgi:hypothetical protein